jgi:hypothetical protein
MKGVFVNGIALRYAVDSGCRGKYEVPDAGRTDYLEKV